MDMKLVLLGTSGVGKSALCLQFVGRSFFEECQPTILDKYRKSVEVDGAQFELEIVDTGGESKCAAFRDEAIRTAAAFMIVCSVDMPQSFADIETFIEHINELKAEDRVPIVLICNKCDLMTWDARSISLNQIAQKHGLQWVQTSAKTADGVENAFKTAIREIAFDVEPKRKKAGQK